MNPESWASIQECERIVRKHFHFLMTDLLFQEPTVRPWASREILILYHNARCLVEIGYEVGGGVGVILNPATGGSL
jgi:hypothetical protein